MSIVNISNFKKIYPHLWSKINEVREQTGSDALDKQYSEDILIPIKMHDAVLAENFLEKYKQNSNLSNPREMLGFTHLIKILKVVENEPMNKWLDILYYPKSNNTELKIKKIKKQSKKESAMTKFKNHVEGEIILNVSLETDANGKTFYRAFDNAGVEYTNEVNNQRKLKYAYINKGVIRGRKNDSGNIIWRVVKEKYIYINTETPDNIDNSFHY